MKHYRMSREKMEAKGFVNIKFIVFLKATLGKMMGTGILPNDFVDLNFWQSWPRKFYNVKSYNSTKETIDPTNDNSNEEGEQLLDEDLPLTQLDYNENDQESPSILSSLVKSQILRNHINIVLIINSFFH